MDKYKRGTGEVFHSLGHPDEWNAALGPEEPWKPRSRSGRGGWRGPWGITPQDRNTWYQPLEEQADIDKAVHWVLGNPDVFLNTAGDVDLLPKILDAASRFQRRPAAEEIEQMAKRNKMSSLFGIGT